MTDNTTIETWKLDLERLLWSYHENGRPDGKTGVIGNPKTIQEFVSHQKALSRAEVLFNRQELEIMYIDYKSLIGVTKMMNRQVVGDKKLEFVLNANDQVREEILAKLENTLSDTLAVVDEIKSKEAK